MSGISSVSGSVPQSSTSTNKQNRLFLLSNSPIVDAAGWGAIGAAGGVFTGAYFEKRLLNNKDSLNLKIAELEKEIQEKIKPEKILKKSQKALEIYKSGKMNWGNIGKLSLFMGAVSFVPSLIINLIIAGVKNVHDKTSAQNKH